ncbi:MAG TPA: flagellar filament outer layer protein FlaA [Spirochaetales bacterium]|nr:flagellar filament outer layer protein FlaA [Spirochaetales bacterium]HRY54371.1 flagellar filament outer layer protein FlaA [Spirochaetia bacterium]
MKQRIVRAVLLSLALLCLSGTGYLFADELTINLESKTVALSAEKDFAGKELFGAWDVLGSKFSSKGFPVKTEIKAWPVAVYGSNPENPNIRSLGVAMLYDRKEYNWVDIFPGTKAEPQELPLPGRVKMLDMWVWSGNYDYYLEAFVRDFKGIVHTVPMGNLNFVGWKNMRVNIPDNIPQSKKYLPRRESMSLVKFRLWTRPTEIVTALVNDPKATDMDKAVKFYFNNIKVLTDTFETLFDGDTLSRPEVVKDAWGAAGNGK